MEKRALGKGLSALIPPKEIESATSQTTESKNDTILQVSIKEIFPNKYQPRTEFNQEKLNELIESIKEKGVVQPILVRKVPEGYELIAGERRWRAAKSVGLQTVPAIVKDVADVDMLEIALIENIQREDLNPIEEAHSFQRFITDFNFTQEKIAKVLGKDRSTIANIMRLLNLPKKIQDLIYQGVVTTGHAKALLTLSSSEEQLRVCNLIVKKGLSVRETESIVSRRAFGVRTGSKQKDPSVIDIETILQQALGTRVKINHGKKRGKMTIEYYSLEDLERIVKIISPKSLTD